MAFPKAWRMLVLLAVTAAVYSSAAAQVSGKLLLGTYKPEPADKAKPSFNWELENGVKEVKPDRIEARRELAVVLLGEPPVKALERVEVTFSGGGLMPATVAVRAGSTLLVRNDDEIGHELYAPGLDGLSAEPTAPRGRRSVNLQTAGSWPLRDKLVTHVKGHLHVLPNLAAVAALEADGQFAFADVQPGKYVLKVFHGSVELLSREVEVGPKPLTLDPLALVRSESAK
jgi:hypothetical protein